MLPRAPGDIGFFERRLLQAGLLKRQSLSIVGCHSQEKPVFADLMTIKVRAVIEVIYLFIY